MTARALALMLLLAVCLGGCAIPKADYVPDEAITRLIPRPVAIEYLKSKGAAGADDTGAMSLSLLANGEMQADKIPYQCMEIEVYKSVPGFDTSYQTRQFMTVRAFGLNTPGCPPGLGNPIIMGPFYDLPTVRRIVESFVALGAKVR